MTAVVIVLDRDRKRARREYFLASANRVAQELKAEGPYPLHTGRAMVDLAVGLKERLGPRSIDHVIVCAHGGTEWLLHPRTGVAIKPRFPQLGQVSVEELAEAWAPLCTMQPLWSLCACLCSRSPTWWLRGYVERVGRPWSAVSSTWGPRSYQRGGEASFSARLRDHLVYPHGLFPKVRGHVPAGDLLGNPLCREHSWPVGEKGIPLSMLALPGEAVTLGLRRWWVRIVKGKLAERWLLGDDSMPAEIATLWRER